jgi:hypothetical protein
VADGLLVMCDKATNVVRLEFTRSPARSPSSRSLPTYGPTMVPALPWTASRHASPGQIRVNLASPP